MAKSAAPHLNSGIEWQVVCGHIGCNIMGPYCHSEAEAAEDWNTRPAESDDHGLPPDGTYPEYVKEGVMWLMARRDATARSIYDTSDEEDSVMKYICELRAALKEALHPTESAAPDGLRSAAQDLFMNCIQQRNTYGVTVPENKFDALADAFGMKSIPAPSLAAQGER